MSAASCPAGATNIPMGTATTGASVCAIGSNCCLNFSAFTSTDITNFS